MQRRGCFISTLIHCNQIDCHTVKLLQCSIQWPYKALPISPASMYRKGCCIPALIPRNQIHCHTVKLFHFLEPFVLFLCGGTFSSLEKILSQTWTCNPLPTLATPLLKSSKLAKHCTVANVAQHIHIYPCSFWLSLNID